MNKKLFKLTAIAFVSGTMLMGCNIKDKNADPSQDMIQDAKQNMAEAKQALNTAIEQFRGESAEIISANEKRIAQFKVKIAEENLENRAILEQKLAEIEKKNIELKAKLANYKNDGSEQWNTFKDEFSHDMKGLGKAFSDLTVKNTN